MDTYKAEDCIKALEEVHVPVSDLLVRYMQSLLEINQKINMTGATTPQELALKHIADVWGALNTLSGLKHPVIDVGSGGGIPGIILGIFSPHTEVLLIERRQKKASALVHLVTLLGMEKQIKVLAKSFEEIKGFHRDAEFWFRGFLPGPKLAGYLSGIDPTAKLGTLVLMKGPKWVEEKIGIMNEGKIKQAWLERFMAAEELCYELPNQSGKRVLVIV